MHNVWKLCPDGGDSWDVLVFAGEVLGTGLVSVATYNIPDGQNAIHLQRDQAEWLIGALKEACESVGTGTTEASDGGK